MIRRLFVDDPWTKLMALVLAVVVWILLNRGLATESDPETVTAEAKLRVVPPRDVEILSVTAADAKGDRLDRSGAFFRLVLRGPRTVLNTLRRRLDCLHTLELKDPVSASEPTTVRSRLRQADFIDLPRGIDIVRIDPEEIEVQVAPFSVRPLRVATEREACLRGSPPAGYQVEQISFNPPRILVRGLRHILDRLNTIPIVPVDVSDRTSSFTQRVQIQDEIQGSRVTTDETIDMTVTIRPADVERSVDGLRVELLFPAAFPRGRDKVRVAEPASVAAVLRGPSRAVEALAASRRIRAVADVAAADLAQKSRGESPLRPIIEDAALSAQVKIEFKPPRATLEIVE
jgi:hypothetical protein